MQKSLQSGNLLTNCLWALLLQVSGMLMDNEFNQLKLNTWQLHKRFSLSWPNSCTISANQSLSLFFHRNLLIFYAKRCCKSILFIITHKVTSNCCRQKYEKWFSKSSIKGRVRRNGCKSWADASQKVTRSSVCLMFNDEPEHWCWES